MNATITRWNPLRELEEFQHRILNAFSPASERHSNGQGNGNNKESLSSPDWFPPVDISENEAEYVIAAELPGLKKEDVKVTMENGMLTLMGERKEDASLRYHRVERCYGTFSRSFALPNDGDASKIRAEFKDGVLIIRVAKSEAAKPKEIEVSVPD